MATTNISHNYTDDEIQEYINQLQQRSTIAFIPTLIYFFLLIIVGIVGNSLVLVVYSTKMARTALRKFIVSMAVFDLITNIVVVPGEIYDLFHMWDFDKPLICQIKQFINAMFVLPSGFLLFAIAATRYMMVCRPLSKQMTLSQAQVISVVVAIIAVVVSIPYAVINGSQTRNTPNPHIKGHYCQVDDRYLPTVWPSLMSSLFVLLFVICASGVIFCYVCIARVTWNQSAALSRSVLSCSSHINLRSRLSGKKVEKKANLKTSGAESTNQKEPRISDFEDTLDVTPEMSSRQVTCSQCSDASNETVSSVISHGEISSDNPDNNLTKRYSRKIYETNFDVTTSDQPHVNISTPPHRFTLTRSKGKRRRLFGRTSLMMLIVTLVFFLGFLPFLGLNIFLSKASQKVAELEGVSLALFQLFFNSYLLNSAANPIVYSVLDRRFRVECLKIFHNLYNRFQLK